MSQGKKVVLSEIQLSWLTLNFATTRNEDCAKELNISPRSVVRIARAMGLEKSPLAMKEWNSQALDKAWRTNRANDWPPKGFIIPNSEKNRFRKGEWSLSKLSPERLAEVQQKRRQTWLKTRRSDELRWKWDLPTRTKFSFGRQSSKKISYRCNMRKRGYVVDKQDPNTLYYPPEIMRSKVAERNASKHGMRVLPMTVQ